MDNILEDLWYDRLEVAKLPCVRKKEYIRAVAAALENESTFEKMLSEEQKVVFEKYQYSEIELTSLTECEIFKHAFSLGCKFAATVFNDES